MRSGSSLVLEKARSEAKVFCEKCVAFRRGVEYVESSIAHVTACCNVIGLHTVLCCATHVSGITSWVSLNAVQLIGFRCWIRSKCHCKGLMIDEFVDIICLKQVQGCITVNSSWDRFTSIDWNQVSCMNNAINVNDRAKMTSINANFWLHYPHACVFIRCISNATKPVDQCTMVHPLLEFKWKKKADLCDIKTMEPL